MVHLRVGILYVVRTRASMDSLEIERFLGGGVHGLTIYLFLVFIARVFLEVCHASAPGAYSYSLHVTPVVRLLEFALAYGIGVMFYERGGTKDIPIVLGTALEIFLVVVVFACISFGEGWPRWAFVSMWLMVVLILSMKPGLISRLLSWSPIVACGKIEMEFFLLHNAIIGIVAACFVAYGLGGYKKIALVSFLVTLVLSIACNRLFGAAGKGHRLAVSADASSQGGVQ